MGDIKCVRGYEWNHIEKRCMLCPRNHRWYNNASDVYLCEPCRDGYFQIELESVLDIKYMNKCIQCPAGEETGEELATDCRPCGFNYYKPDGDISCLPCPPGTSTPTNGSTLETDCELCPTNTYRGNEDIECEPCPNLHTSDSGSTSIIQCKAFLTTTDVSGKIQTTGVPTLIPTTVRTDVGDGNVSMMGRPEGSGSFPTVAVLGSVVPLLTIALAVLFIFIFIRRYRGTTDTRCPCLFGKSVEEDKLSSKSQIPDVTITDEEHTKPPLKKIHDSTTRNIVGSENKAGPMLTNKGLGAESKTPPTRNGPVQIQSS